MSKQQVSSVRGNHSAGQANSLPAIFDRYCIVKELAKELLADYGHDAYEAFCVRNPYARDREYEAQILAKAEGNVIPQLCGPYGRVMP
jgi:hypothetical protein